LIFCCKLRKEKWSEEGSTTFVQEHPMKRSVCERLFNEHSAIHINRKHKVHIDKRDNCMLLLNNCNTRLSQYDTRDVYACTPLFTMGVASSMICFEAMGMESSYVTGSGGGGGGGNDTDAIATAVAAAPAAAAKTRDRWR
jgi:hypothetical protein